MHRRLQNDSKKKQTQNKLLTHFYNLQRICAHPLILIFKNEEEYLKSEEEEGSIKDFIDDDDLDTENDSSDNSFSNSSQKSLPQTRRTRAIAENRKYLLYPFIIHKQTKNHIRFFV